MQSVKFLCSHYYKNHWAAANRRGYRDPEGESALVEITLLIGECDI